MEQSIDRILTTHVGSLPRNQAVTDCGFSTFAGYAGIDPEIAYTKLASLAEGARRASERLW